MVAPKSEENEISRDRLAELLNEDLSRKYQAIIAYIVPCLSGLGPEFHRANQLSPQAQPGEEFASVIAI